ncbi:hypothetical protein Pyn_37973 [Prunus yedoensis var. nudiflora]|uniref:Uncharacterized protein n=1 Tax=Prunus yedoensis var. nudiflora TaxID=2094558 RepID=A0A314XSF3_PRUYE|nr:hypothetical protein Pyn_37973 [Prunus yedoensis var. nudiflora]
MGDRHTHPVRIGTQSPAASDSSHNSTTSTISTQISSTNHRSRPMGPHVNALQSPGGNIRTHEWLTTGNDRRHTNTLPPVQDATPETHRRVLPSWFYPGRTSTYPVNLVSEDADRTYEAQPDDSSIVCFDDAYAPACNIGNRPYKNPHSVLNKNRSVIVEILSSSDDED